MRFTKKDNPYQMGAKGPSEFYDVYACIHGRLKCFTAVDAKATEAEIHKRVDKYHKRHP